MFPATILVTIILAVAHAQLPQNIFQLPNLPGIPVTAFTNPSTGFASTFPWLNPNNGINTRLGPFGFGNGGISPNSFLSALPWTPGNGPISGPITQALQAMQIPLNPMQGIQAFTNLFRPQLPPQSQLNNVPVGPGSLPVFQQENGPTLNNLNSAKPTEQESIDSVTTDLSHFPISEVQPGQVNTPGSDLIADFLNEEKAEGIKAIDRN